MLTTHDDYLRLRIHRDFKSKVVEYCKTNKIKMSKFVRQALKEKMDREDIKTDCEDENR